MYILCNLFRIRIVTSVKRHLSYAIPKRCLCEKVLDVNTNVTKDFSFWAYLSVFAFSTLRDAPVEKPEKETVWWRKINLGENKYKNGLSILCFTIGFGVLTITWMYTLRSVKYLILRKGGQKVTVVTHTPFGENRMMTLGLENLSSKQMRTEAKSYLPIKIRGHMMYYMVDLKGEFRHPQLFDSTCGLARTWK